MGTGEHHWHIPHISTDTISGSTSAPATTTSFDMLSSLSDSSAHSATIHSTYLALPITTRPGHARRQSHSHVQSTYESARHAAHAAMPQLTRTVSLGRDGGPGGKGIPKLSPSGFGIDLGGMDFIAPDSSSFAYDPSPDMFDTSMAVEGEITPDMDFTNMQGYFNDPLSGTEPETPRKSVRGPNLKRGRACGFCRHRKLRCTGDVPKCTSCIKYKRDKCEYSLHRSGSSVDMSATGSGVSGGERSPGTYK